MSSRDAISSSAQSSVLPKGKRTESNKADQENGDQYTTVDDYVHIDDLEQNIGGLKSEGPMRAHISRTAAPMRDFAICLSLLKKKAKAL